MPQNSNKKWSDSEVQKLKLLVRGNTPTRVIGIKLGRSESSIQAKASQENISLKPTNKSPYNRRKK